MKLKLIYPRWPKLPNQPVFNLPPVGPTVFAAALPEDVEVEFYDENVEEINFASECDLVAISCMLTCQTPRAFELADRFRADGKTVLMGGIAIMLHSEEAAPHADSIFLGEAEGRMEGVLADFAAGKLKPVYNFLNDFPDTALIPYTAVLADEDGQEYVYVVEDGKAVRTVVETGSSNSTEVVILSGIEEGDVVVTAGNVSDGTSVSIV